MKSFIPLFLISSFALSSFGESPRKLFRKNIDINKDGKADRIEVYLDKEHKTLFELHEDRNVDGYFERITKYKIPGTIKRIYVDTNSDKKFDRIETHKLSIRDKQKVQVKIQIDKDHDGKYEIEYKNHYDLIQNSDCTHKEYSFGTESIDKFSILMSSIAANAVGGFIPTSFGYEIDPQCINNWGANFPEFLKESIFTGISCLKNLKGNGAKTLAHDLESLLSKNNVTVVCSETDYLSWTGVYAHASAGPDSEKILDGKVSHPYISVNPGDPASGLSKDEVKQRKQELRKTLFHEQIHNLGHVHYHGVEYAYPCEDCCLSYDDPSEDDKKEEERVKAACRACDTEHIGGITEDYLEVLRDYTGKAYLSKNFRAAVTEFNNENPENQVGHAYIAMTNSSYFNPIGHHIASMIKVGIDEEDPKITKVNKMLNDVDNDKDLKSSEEYRKLPEGRFIASAIYDAYVVRDLELTLKNLENELPKTIDSLRAKRLDKDEYNDYYADNVKDAIKALVTDLYLNDHLDKDNKYISRRAKLWDLTKEL